MKHGCVLILIALFAAGCHRGGGTDPDDQPVTETANTNYSVEHNAAGETVVNLSPETQQRIGLQTASVESAQLQPIVSAYGAVLDPGPLISLQADLVTAQSSLDMAGKLAQRARDLYAQDQTVSQKALESAENDVRMDNIKFTAAHRIFELNWGDAIARMDATNRQNLIDRLAAHQCALVRVDLPIGENLTHPPPSCRLRVEGRPATYSAAMVSPAPSADPKVLGQGFFLRVDPADAALVPGAAVVARMEIPGPPKTGVAIPDAAVIRTGGKIWVYVAGADNKFTRREVMLDSPTDHGWFSANGLSAGDKVVVQGAELLLSEEEKAQIQGGD